MKLVTVPEMVAIDRRTIDGGFVPGLELMEAAGRGIAAMVVEELGGTGGGTVLIVCGKGNNGGDGLVVARLLAISGVTPLVYIVGKSDELKGDARNNFDRLQDERLGYKEIREEADIEKLMEDCNRTDVIVDALLGTGVKGPVTGLTGSVIEAVNRSGLPVVAVDVPSGLDLDAGLADSACIRARVTGTMAFPKQGHLFYPGRSYVGSLRVIDIGVPDEVTDEFDLSVELPTRAELRSLIPQRDPAGHKGTFGHLFIVAGSVGLTGAAALSSVGALRAGCGLVTLGLPGSLNDLMEVKLTEVMTLPLPETPERSLAPEALEQVAAFMKNCRAMVVGPGLSRHPRTGELVLKLLPMVNVPLLVDADGLNAVAADITCLEPNASRTVVTPHYGELERLTGIPVEESKRDPIGSARKAAQMLQVVVALKGAPTVVATPEGRASVNPSGNSGLATAGSGDVLSGIIGGFLAQGLTPFQAARLGVFLHGLAADVMAGQIGEHGLVAGDLLQMVPGVIKNLLMDETEEPTNIVDLF